jgi:hypothetical protein
MIPMLDPHSPWQRGDDARAVLEKLAPVDREIRSLAQSWYLTRVSRCARPAS